MFRSVFVNTEALAAKVGAVTLLDARFSLADPKGYGRGQFCRSRAAGAIFADTETVLSKPASGSTARHPLPPAAEFADWCCANGVGRRPVVCYDDMGGAMAASRLWWMLTDLGAEAYILDGGIQAYVAAGLPTEAGTAEPTVEPLPSWPHRTQWGGIVAIDDLPGAARIVDARSAERFGSTVRPGGPDPLPGHIPDAVNFPFGDNQRHDFAAGEATVLRPADDLRRMWGDRLAGTPAEAAVHSCGSGVSACMNIACCAHAGLGRGLLYPGSWSEYAGARAEELRQVAVAAFGVVVEKVTVANPAGAAASCESRCIVDGTPGVVGEHPEEMRRALCALRGGEEAVLRMKDGATVVVTIV